MTNRYCAFGRPFLCIASREQRARKSPEITTIFSQNINILYAPSKTKRLFCHLVEMHLIRRGSFVLFVRNAFTRHKLHAQFTRVHEIDARCAQFYGHFVQCTAFNAIKYNGPFGVCVCVCVNLSAAGILVHVNEHRYGERMWGVRTQRANEAKRVTANIY